MEIGLMFFADTGTELERPYKLLLDASQLADELGLSAIWTPERHFHRFGGIYPNPAVTGAAVAAVTKRIRIRAGSVIAPLHNVLRIVEEFSVLDNLSNGRVDISFGTGWHPNDFVLNPDCFANRRELTLEIVEEARRLWRGEHVVKSNGVGKQVEVRVYPRPQQAELHVWLTALNNEKTFYSAGAIGANILTHLVGQSLSKLKSNIEAYRSARAKAGYNRGCVSLMLHTYIDTDLRDVERVARKPFLSYLESWMSLQETAAGVDTSEAPAHLREMGDELRNLAFQDYLESRSLMGTPESCSRRLEEFEVAGVDEVACLIDFGIPFDDVLAGVRRLAYLN
jgi:natural product biosynthesis luciferase-like monooxygenase protein